MNATAKNLVARKVAELEQIADSLQLMIDNPDEADLNLQEDAELRNIIGMARSTQEELIKFQKRT